MMPIELTEIVEVRADSFVAAFTCLSESAPLWCSLVTCLGGLHLTRLS
jgi:hypothetical protein